MQRIVYQTSLKPDDLNMKEIHEKAKENTQKFVELLNIINPSGKIKKNPYYLTFTLRV